ncbi:hypothetical protein KIPB_015477, partial [Kipferlia bialata]
VHRHFRNADTPNQMVIIMDLVEGETLEDYLQRHPERCAAQPLPCMLSIMHQVTLALVGLRKAGVIHRDIKVGTYILILDGKDTFVDTEMAKDS